VHGEVLINIRDGTVTVLGELPAGQQQNRVDYIGNTVTYAGGWRHFMP
jgi:hypothetical protein